MSTTTAARPRGALAADLERMLATFLDGDRTPLPRRIAFALSNSELHCVACYRFGRFVDRLRARAPIAALPLIVAHRLWNRWATHVDHCDISTQADIGPGLLLMHRHGVIVGGSQIGRNVVIHQNVTIGQRVSHGDHGLPEIGDNVWIGPGATIVGGIRVGEGATISAGTVLSRDVPPRALVAGVPGRVVTQDYDNREMLGHVVA